jgi:collagenase-like PrtC family protease
LTRVNSARASIAHNARMNAIPTEIPPRMELVCPAGNLPSLRAAVDNGADAVYLGFRDGLNARNFPGLNFATDEAGTGIEYAHSQGVRVFVALNVYPRPCQWLAATAAVDRAADLGADAVIMADPGLMRYARQRHPALRLHLSVQASATNWQALEFYRREFGVRRAVLPRVLSLAQVRRIVARSPLEIEVFGFGSLCVMAEGRCALSAYVTGESPNTHGVCSPARAVSWREKADGREARLNGVLIDEYANGEPAGYPTLCKGRFVAGTRCFHALEEPTSLNALDILPELLAAGVRAIKVEGRQRGPAYVAQVTRALRTSLDACLAGQAPYREPLSAARTLVRLAEGGCHTLGAYERPWQ